MSAIVHRVGEGERHAMGASEVVIKATGEDTGGAFFVAEVVLEAGFPGPPRHFHRRLHETVYVLEGELTMTLGDKVAVLTPGDFASIPPGVVHTFRNDSAQPARAQPQRARGLGALPARARRRGERGPDACAHGRDRLAPRLPAGLRSRRRIHSRTLRASRVPDSRYTWTCSRRPAKAPG